MTSHDSTIILADDATGAVESGAALAAHGYLCEVRLARRALAPGSAATVLDTETRHLPREEAYRHIGKICSDLAAGTALFKKTDSTLRGPIGAELTAVADWAGAPIVYMPAYPERGRTVRNGALFVDRVPVHETAFGSDPRDPVRTSSIVEILRQGYAGRITSVQNAESLRLVLAGADDGIIVCDGETIGDQEKAADVVCRYPGRLVVAGPAGFLPLWARCAGLPQGQIRRDAVADSFLVICGSRHPRALQQAEYAASQAIDVLSAPAGLQADAEAVAADLARGVERRLATHRPDALVVFGGDTLAAICRRFGWDSLRPLGEIEPGVSLSTVPGADMLVIAKAGGFGAVDLLRTIKEQLAR